MMADAPQKEIVMRTAFCMVILALSAARIASAQTTAASKPVEACSLLTKEDAAAALGETATGPKATNMPNGGPSACEFTGSGIHSVQLNVYPLKPGEAAMYAAICAKKTHDGLTGLGDTTCWYNEKHGELQVL